MSRKFYPIVLACLFLFSYFPLFSQSFKQLKDINPGTAGSSYFNFTSVNGVLYFRPDDGIHGDELWKTNGTEAGTVLVKDINPGNAGSELQEFINVNGILYFRANDGAHGSELWKSDGTQAGTVMIKDINPGLNGGITSTLFTANGIVYFQANDGVHGNELWKSDGTQAGTLMIKDIYPGAYQAGPAAGTPYSSNPDNFTIVNGTVYFAAIDGDDRHQIWKTDGSAAGTVLVKDIYSGIPGYALTNFTSYNGALMLTVYGGAGGNELWKSDGTNTGTVLIKSMPGGNYSNHAVVMNGTLYFLEGDGLWKSDGTEEGTVLLKQKEGSFALSPELMTGIDGLLYFTLNDDTHGMELWKSNGTAAGTVLLKDIYPGGNASDINTFTKVGNNLMFSANDGINGNEIWISDGTETGTKMIQDIEPGPGSSMTSAFYELKGNIIEVSGKVFIAATTSVLGNEVWAGNAPAAGPLPVELLDFKGSLVNNNGFLQWKTENETNTSVFVVERSIDAVTYQSVGTLLAANAAGIHQYKLADPNITSLGVTVVYYRLKQIDLDGKFRYSNIVTLAVENKYLTVRLLSNPVNSQINLTISSYQPQKLQWRFTDKVGRLIKAGTYSVAQGSNFISEDIGFVSSGVYYMHLFNGTDLQETIKILKQ
jgi:trimeric autotransporter adhesin